MKTKTVSLSETSKAAANKDSKGKAAVLPKRDALEVILSADAVAAANGKRIVLITSFHMLKAALMFKIHSTALNCFVLSCHEFS